MSRHIKFNSFGVPYVLEFENVSFTPEHPCHQSPSPPSSTSSFCYIDNPPPPPRRPSFSLRSPSSLFRRKPTVTTSSTSLSESLPCCAVSKSTKQPVSEANGIYIRFPPECSLSAMTRKERLVHLQQIISVAVLDAGMSRSPGNPNTEKHSNGNSSRRYRTPDALFCGTYGQVMAALEAAGLSAAPCAGDSEDLPGCRRLVSSLWGRTVHSDLKHPADTRLGALFVARNNGASGVQLRKITLWG